jgi:hypothetical protein
MGELRELSTLNKLTRLTWLSLAASILDRRLKWLKLGADVTVSQCSCNV